MLRSRLLYLIALPIIALLAGCGPLITRPTPTPPQPTAPVSLATVTPRATSTLAPSTPIPTDSPTPTPTPIIYILKAGDSLWSVAWEYDVSVEAIQEVNGITDPRTLQIGQELIIPRDKEAQKNPITPTPTPVPLELANLGFYETPTGGLWCLGEIWNRSGSDAELVQVAVSLYNADRRVLLERSAFTEADIVAQDGRAPFGVLFEQKPPDFAAYQAWIVSGEPVTHLGSRYRDLQVVHDSGEPDGEALIVSGQVENAGEVAATDVTVIVTAYDAEGLVTGFRQTAVTDETLPPAAQSRFQVRVMPAGGTIDSYRVQAQGWRGQ
jgi:LysM repeat protein